jgi:membrane protein DedA with SNARE-associated domain
MQLGYIGIIALMVFSPIPPELFMPLAGFMVAQGQLSFIGVVAMGVLGFLISSVPWYLAGKLLGEKRLTQLVQRHSRWLTLPTQDIKQGKRWFRRHGVKAILVCLLIPGTRNLIMLPAGLSGIPIPTFLVSTTLGATVWLTTITALGYFLGERYHLVEQHSDSIPALVVLTALIAAGIWLTASFWQRRNRRLKRRQG